MSIPIGMESHVRGGYAETTIFASKRPVVRLRLYGAELAFRGLRIPRRSGAPLRIGAPRIHQRRLDRRARVEPPMSNTPNRAGNSTGKSRRKELVLDLPTARQMLPLVRSIVMDIVSTRGSLVNLAPEQERLDRHRRDLAWQERQRRYQVGEEITAAEKSLNIAVNELQGLGVSLVDAESGEVDFPTRINGRSAAFSWRHGEERLEFWHYSGEELRRPIPADWQLTSAVPSRYRNQP